MVQPTHLMKKSIMTAVCCLSLLGLTAGYGLERDRTFTSADGAKTFDGFLVDYDSSKNVVSVRLAGKSVKKFSLDKLSEADQKFVQDNADALAASRSLKVRIDEKYRDSNSIDKADGARSSTRVEGFNISVENLGSERIEDVEIRSTIFVRRAAERGPSQLQMEVDSYTIESLSGKRKQMVKTKGVPVVRVLRAGDAGC